MTTETRNRSTRSEQQMLPPVEEREWKQALWEVSDAGVLAITINRPERLNALNYPLLREMIQLLDHAAETQEIRAVSIRGIGTRAFSTGDDLSGMDSDPLYDSGFTGHHELVRRIRALPKPVVALVCGWALGAGWELACACDLRLAADNIEVGDHRASRAIGMIAGTSWFFPRIVGMGRALELLMTGAHLDAEQALDWGWANRVYPLDEFDERAGEYMEMLAKLPTVAVGAFKSAIEYSLTHGLRDSLVNEKEVSGRNIGTEDSEEGRRSFVERREPVFKGR
jgi:enoyl-CoA hydratase/carnithine racemase